MFSSCCILQHPFLRSHQAVLSCSDPPRKQLSHLFSIASFHCWPPHEIEALYLPFQSLSDFCLSIHLYRKISSQSQSAYSSRLFVSGRYLLQKLTLVRSSHQTKAKAFCYPFPRIHNPFCHGTQMRVVTKIASLPLSNCLDLPVIPCFTLSADTVLEGV